MRAVPIAVAVLVVSAAGRAQAQPVPVASPPSVEQKGASASGEGFVLSSESGDFRLQLRGYAHFDGRFYPGDEAGAATDSFLVRRVRPILSGTVGKYFDFNLTPDFGGGAAVIQDAYVELRASPRVRVRVGKQKSPVGLERLQSATALAFVERSYPSALLPVRDVGVQVTGDLVGGVVHYAGGVFDGAPDGGNADADLQDSKDLAGRLFLSPWKRGGGPLKDLGFGVAGTVGDQTGPPPRTAPAGSSPSSAWPRAPSTTARARGGRRSSPSIRVRSGCRASTRGRARRSVALTATAVGSSSAPGRPRPRSC